MNMLYTHNITIGIHITNICGNIVKHNDELQ